MSITRRRRHQDVQDDARCASIDDIVRMIAQIRSILRQHQCRVWVGGAHLQIRHTLIAATGYAAVLCSQLLKPVMPLGILLGEVLLLLR